MEAVLFALSVAIGLTPEMLPMIISTNLAKGAVAMSKKKVIVKDLNSIQNFGSMDVLCTDKTGTLTQDRVILEYSDVYKRQVDINTVCKMTDIFLERGFTYFDTAYMYHNFKSEEVIKEALVKRHPRESFVLADKLPTCLLYTSRCV